MSKSKHSAKQFVDVPEIELKETLEANTSDNLENKQKENIEQDEMSHLKASLAEANDKHIRLFSEFENYRRRTAKEKLDLIKTASENVILALLPVMDDFERAMAHEKDETQKQGVALIYHKLQNTLQQQGLKELEIKEGHFDPDTQEAIAQMPASEESQKGKVLEVVQKGYTLHDKVIRIAKVVVAN